jgi:hypothetical protein
MPFWSKFRWASGVVPGGITTRLQWGAKMKEVRGVLSGFVWEGHLLSPTTSKELISLYIDYQLMQVKIVQIYRHAYQICILHFIFKSFIHPMQTNDSPIL